MKHKLKRLLKYPYLNRIDRGGVYDDKAHLKACMDWLYNSTHGFFMRSHYDMAGKEWGKPYYEITGYCIPTFMAYYKLIMGEQSYYAQWMGEALLEVQYGDGTIIEIGDKEPRVFNMAQIMLGWLALYEELKDDKFLHASVKAADWIVKQQDNDGCWRKYVYDTHPMQIRIAWALRELKNILNTTIYNHPTRLTNYQNAEHKQIEWFKKQEIKGWEHFNAYALVGADKLGIKHKKATDTTDNQLTGRAQYAFLCDEDTIEYLKELQYMGSKFHGALPGSEPLYGKYFCAAIPTWGVKFFADALIKRLGGETRWLG